MRTREEQLENQVKQYNWEQDQIAHMKVISNFYLTLSDYNIYVYIFFLYRIIIYVIYNINIRPSNII